MLSGTTVREGSSRNITVYSYNRSENVDRSCHKAQDSDRDFLWKCTTEFNSIVYVFPRSPDLPAEKNLMILKTLLTVGSALAISLLALYACTIGDVEASDDGPTIVTVTRVVI